MNSEKMSFEVAQDEANRIKEKIQKGEAENFDEAEKLVENEKNKKITFALDDKVLEKYVERVEGANAEEDIESVSVESKDGKKMMGMIKEFEGFLEKIKGSDLKYSIDGAIGLSLRQLGKTNLFLRKHRDIDVLVLEDELEKLNERLSLSGDDRKWGIFVWHTEDANSGEGMSFTKFNPVDFRGKEMLVAMPVNKDGAPDTERYDGLTLVDVHYLKKEGEKYNYNRLSVDLDDIFSNETINLPDGEKIAVVDLVHLAIGKAKSPRKQDRYDLNYILENVSDLQKERIKSEINELLKNTDNEEEKKEISLAIKKII